MILVVRKTIIVVCTVVALSTVGIVGFYAGSQVASDRWMHRWLRQTADKVCLLERAKAVVGPASRDEIEWLEQENRDAEEVLSHEEFAEVVEKDQIIRRLRNLVSELRKKRGK